MVEKMKIAFFSGPLEYSVCLANALSESCEVSFFYGVRYVHQRGDSLLDLLRADIARIPVNNYRMRDLRNTWSYLKIAKSLKNYDIVHIQAENIWLALWRSLYRRVPIVYTAHDPYQHIGLKKSNLIYQDMVQKWIITHSSKIFVLGQNMKEDVHKRYRFPKNNIAVLPHGEFSFYKELRAASSLIHPAEKKCRRILYFGTITEYKGLDVLIKAEPLISRQFKDFKICIAGRFPGNRGDYEGLMQNKDRFEILDRYIPNDQVAWLFERSDIIVLPYLSATQSGVLAIAFSFGKPVVASNVGSISEVLEHGKHGLLVPSGDEKALAEALLELLCDEEKCSRFGKNAEDFSKSRLSWKNIAAETVQVYQSATK